MTKKLTSSILALTLFLISTLLYDDTYAYYGYGAPAVIQSPTPVISRAPAVIRSVAPTISKAPTVIRSTAPNISGAPTVIRSTTPIIPATPSVIRSSTPNISGVPAVIQSPTPVIPPTPAVVQTPPSTIIAPHDPRHPHYQNYHTGESDSAYNCSINNPYVFNDYYSNSLAN